MSGDRHTTLACDHCGLIMPRHSAIRATHNKFRAPEAVELCEGCAKKHGAHPKYKPTESPIYQLSGKQSPFRKPLTEEQIARMSEIALYRGIEEYILRKEYVFTRVQIGQELVKLKSQKMISDVLRNLVLSERVDESGFGDKTVFRVVRRS